MNKSKTKSRARKEESLEVDLYVETVGYPLRNRQPRVSLNLMIKDDSPIQFVADTGKELDLGYIRLKAFVQPCCSCTNIVFIFPSETSLTCSETVLLSKCQFQLVSARLSDPEVKAIFKQQSGFQVSRLNSKKRRLDKEIVYLTVGRPCTECIVNDLAYGGEA